MTTLYSAYYSERDPFNLFSNVKTVCHPDELGKKGVLILWGGEDISPSLYGQVAVKAHAANIPSKRDIIEAELFKTAVKLGMPIIGVCRGAQLACVLSGGTLYQHIVGGHHGNHDVLTYDGQVLNTSSCHHQALNLTNVDHKLLAWDRDRTTRAHTDTEVVDVVIPEVVLLNKTKTFAIQGHPEWMALSSPFVQWCRNEFSKEYM